MPPRPAALLVRASIAVTLLALGQCAQPSPPARPQSAATRLIARALDDIGAYYIAPLGERNLVLAGAENVTRLDRGLLVEESPGSGRGAELVLTQNARQLAVFPEPADGNRDLWAALLSGLVADATAASPKLLSLPRERIDTALLDGMVGPLDRFSRYSSPQQARAERALRDGFGGIGIVLDDSKKGLVVTAVLPHGPAARAGVRPQDRITAIDGTPSSNLPEKEIIARLLGPVGSEVTLALYRPQPPQNLRLSIRRGRIVIPAVSLSEAQGIAFFRISSFNETTAKIVARRLLSAERPSAPPLKGVILDLRGNPGGLLQQAVELSDVFLKGGPIVSTIGRNPESNQYFVASGDGIAPSLPVVVLLDGGSASSSEIVASTLQDRKRAVVLGGSSYGKGTVQTVLPLPNQGALTLTWARLITPGGYFLQHHGVVPNLCTSTLGAGRDAPPRLIRQAQAEEARAPLLSKPRGSLDEAGWKRLRAACPGRERDPMIDLKFARRLLSDPRLYAEALGLVAAAKTPFPSRAFLAAGASAPGLTGPRGLLFFVRHPL